jgi:hypothetical protein
MKTKPISEMSYDEYQAFLMTVDIYPRCKRCGKVTESFYPYCFPCQDKTGRGNMMTVGGVAAQ